MPLWVEAESRCDLGPGRRFSHNGRALGRVSVWTGVAR